MLANNIKDIKNIKTRFAPSPTGEMHFGNLRTALFNVLAAIKYQGIFLLRVEDTDDERSSKEYEYLLYKDLKWLGIQWQEGADLNLESKQEVELGNNGPYRQSQRAEIYNKFYQQLLDNNQAYHCFCSEAQLALSRKLQRAQGLPPRYNGTCANLSQEEVAEKIASGQKPTIRFRVNNNIDFIDLVKGQQSFKASDIGDFIIRRANGTASFMFCNAVDDALMGVNLALRGEDHLTNTPRQLLILKALGILNNKQAINYGHISLIVGSDGSPLSKRHGSKSVKSLRESGYLAIAIVNYLARLGHKYEDQEKLYNIEELGQKFNLDNLSKSPAHYDEQHLNHWQKEAVLSMNFDEFKQWLTDFGVLNFHNVSNSYKDLFIKIMQENISFPSEAKLWADILFADNIDYTEQQLIVLKSVDSSFYSKALEYLDNNSLDIKELTNYLKNQFNIKGKQLFMPIRVCLTMQEHGPELVNLVNIMGIDKVRQRLEYAKNL